MRDFLSFLSRIGRFLVVVLLVGCSVVALPTEANGGIRSLTQAPLTEWVSEVQHSILKEEAGTTNKIFISFFGRAITTRDQVQFASQRKLFLSIKKSLLQSRCVRFRSYTADFLI